MKHVSEVGAAPEGARLPLNVHYDAPELATTCDELETLPVFFVAAQSHTELPVIGLSSNYFSVAPEFPHFLLRAEAAIRDGGHTAARLEASPNAATFYLHRGYLPSEARTDDGALPLSKRLSPHPPQRPAGSAGG